MSGGGGGPAGCLAASHTSRMRVVAGGEGWSSPPPSQTRRWPPAAAGAQPSHPGPGAAAGLPAHCYPVQSNTLLLLCLLIILVSSLSYLGRSSALGDTCKRLLRQGWSGGRKSNPGLPYIRQTRQPLSHAAPTLSQTARTLIDPRRIRIRAVLVRRTAKKIPFMYSFSGNSWLQSKFPHSCVCE
jgi:hypothetical protein